MRARDPWDLLRILGARYPSSLEGFAGAVQAEEAAAREAQLAARAEAEALKQRIVELEAEAQALEGAVEEAEEEEVQTRAWTRDAAAATSTSAPLAARGECQRGAKLVPHTGR